ncbi:MAG: type II toxin-antitoxin system VapC family toxin [Caulobacteraceae bacterium]
MRLLLDTHVALWAVAMTRALPAEVQAVIADAENEVWVSAVTIWEIAIKHALGRGRSSDLSMSASEALQLYQNAGYRLLSVSPEHAVAVESLPPIHGDPFDRILVAQALTEPLRLITHDAKVAAYGGAIIHF